jgi:ribonuclease HI
MSDKLPRVTIYTDGACKGNPGPGGWAALLRFKNSVKEISGFEESTTNNRMELTAAIQALKAVKWRCHVDLYTDSTYVKRGITEWLPMWKKQNWKRKKGILANVDLWKALDKTIHNQEIEWHWVRGHAGNSDNNRVDRLARHEIANHVFK